MDNKAVIGGGIIVAALVGGGLYFLSKKNTSTTPSGGGVPQTGQFYSVVIIAPDKAQKSFVLSQTDFNKVGGLSVTLGSVSTSNSSGLNTYDDVLNWLFLHQNVTSTSPPPTGGSTTPPITGGIAGGQPPNSVPTGVQISNLIISPTSGIAPVGVSFQLQGVTVASTILWDFGDGQKISGGLVQSHEYFTAGTYNGSVHVTGPDGFSTDYRNFAIVVRSVNTRSFINLDQISPTVQQGQSAGFSISLGKAYSTITWDFGDGTPKVLNITNPSHLFSKSGVFSGSVIVVATDGTTDMKTFVTTVSPNPLSTMNVSIRAGPATTSVIYASNVQFYVGELIEFQAEIGGGVSPFKITWDFGDGTSPTGEFVNKSFSSSGTKTAKCTVSDNNGNTQTATLNIVVSVLPLQSLDVVIVPSPLNGKYFLNDGVQPLGYISYVGGAKNTRTDRSVQIKCIIQIYRTDLSSIASSYSKIVTVPANSTLNFSFFIGQIMNDGKTAANIIYDATEPLVGTELHLDEKLGVFP
jgi:PKD repeat protein